MAGRYLVTGAQLGLIAGMAKAEMTTKILETTQQIQTDQYVGESEQSIEDDVVICFNSRLVEDNLVEDTEEHH